MTLVGKKEYSLYLGWSIRSDTYCIGGKVWFYVHLRLTFGTRCMTFERSLHFPTRAVCDQESSGETTFASGNLP